MTNKIKTALLSLTLLVAPAAFACDYPERPTIPDGSTASKDQMLEAKADVTAYLAGVDEYLVCIETEEKEAVAAMDNPDDAELKRRDQMLSKKFDAANEEKALVGEEFNQQVRAFNAARQGD